MGQVFCLNDLETTNADSDDNEKLPHKISSGNESVSFVECGLSFQQINLNAFAQALTSIKGVKRKSIRYYTPEKRNMW